MKLSIVMPTYNGMKYVEQAVNSVLTQKYRDWELIISDDGSTDGTRDYLATLQDPRIRIHYQPKNLNIFGNLNFLVSQVQGEITQIFCQDDYFNSDNSLDLLLRQWDSLPEDIAFLRMNHTSEANKGLARYEGSVLKPIINPEDSDLLFFIFGCLPGNLSNVSFHTVDVKGIYRFRSDLRYAGDFEFWSRLGHEHSWAISRTKITQVRSHGEQASNALNPSGELLPQLCYILDALYARLIQLGYSPSLLRLLATLNYASQHRYNGVRVITCGGSDAYLKRVSSSFDQSASCFGVAVGWVIFFASLEGRLFKIPVARMLLNRSRALSDTKS